MKYFQATVALAIFLTSAQAQIQLNGPTGTATGQRADGLVFADWNGDGIQDMAVATSGTGNLDLIEVYEGDATGAFVLRNTVFLASGSAPHSLAGADFDGDGDMDLAVSLRNSNQIQFVRNGGGFLFVPGSASSAGGIDPRQVSAVDMDGDGDMDVVYSLRDSSAIGVVRNQAGVFSLLGAFPAGDDVRDHAVGDWDGDGDMDAAASSHDDRSVRVLLNNGLGVLQAAGTLFVPGATRPTGLASGDLDGDGDMDLVAAVGDDRLVGLNFASVFINNGGIFSGPLNLSTGGLDADDVVVGDFSANGSLDLAVSHTNSGMIALIANAGGGSFGVATPMAVTPPASVLVAHDVDSNGGVDLAALARQAAGVRVFLNAQGDSGPGNGYCSTNPNSTGQSARLTAIGSNGASANNLVLTVDRLPAGVFGFFIASQSQGFVAMPGGSIGNLCLGGMIGRMNQVAFFSDGAGLLSALIDTTSLPTPMGPTAVLPGQTWNFQLWHRDTVAGQPASNFSNGYSISFQ